MLAFQCLPVLELSLQSHRYLGVGIEIVTGGGSALLHFVAITTNFESFPLRYIG
jgi:hypothetical protein